MTFRRFTVHPCAVALVLSAATLAASRLLAPFFGSEIPVFFSAAGAGFVIHLPQVLPAMKGG